MCLPIGARLARAAAATYAPQGAFFEGQNGRTAFTHGVQFGVAQGTGNLQRDTQSLLQSFARSNPRPPSAGKCPARHGEWASGTHRQLVECLGRHRTGRGTLRSRRLHCPKDSILYMIGVVPQTEGTEAYTEAFRARQTTVGEDGRRDSSLMPVGPLHCGI